MMSKGTFTFPLSLSPSPDLAGSIGGNFMTNRKTQIERLTVGAIFTALVVILQLLGSFIRFGPFSISLVLVPIVLGAALGDFKMGGWLGFVFGVTVLISGDALAFLAVSVPGTIITVLLKGTLCGAVAGLVYKLLENKNRYLSVITAAIICPVVNTGVFLLGCKVFFMDTITEWGAALGFPNVAAYMFLGLAGGNFLFELAANIILAPIVLRIINIFKK